MKTSKKGGSSSGKSATSAEPEIETLDVYEASAKYYDIWSEDFKEDIEFYKQLAESAGSPILECMCGTGRILIPLAKAGYDITGVDRSASMLDRCTEKIELLDEEVQERIDIIHADVMEFKSPSKFKLVIVPFNSFLHLLETADQEKALGNMVDHMADDGLLTISIFNPRLDRPVGLLRHDGTKLTAQGEIISKFETQTFDMASQTTTVHYFYDVSRQDRQLRRVTTTFVLRYIFYREAMDLFRRCGLDVLEVYGDYALSPFKKESELMIFVARKAR